MVAKRVGSQSSTGNGEVSPKNACNMKDVREKVEEDMTMFA